MVARLLNNAQRQVQNFTQGCILQITTLMNNAQAAQATQETARNGVVNIVIPTATANRAGVFSTGWIWIPNYRSDKYKQFLYQVIGPNDVLTDPSSFAVSVGGGLFKSTAALVSLTLGINNGSESKLEAHSTVTVYGVTGA